MVGQHTSFSIHLVGAFAGLIFSAFIGCSEGGDAQDTAPATAIHAPAAQPSIASDPAQQRQAPPSEDPTATSFPPPGEHANALLTSTIIDAPNATFGYDVFSDGKLFLHQTNLPGQPGVEGCKTKADAEKLAAFVIEKIKKGEMPPTVTTEELKTLGLIP